MKFKNIMIGLAAALTLTLGACDDKLDIPKHGNMGGQEDYYKTDSEAMSALASLYGSWGGNYYNWFLLTNLLSDDSYTGGGSRGDNPGYERINEYNFDTDDGTVEGVYSGLYAIIYKANLIIEKVACDTPVKTRAVAEAYFHRGWAHFQLVTLWGTAPVVDHLLNPDEYRKGNSTPEELWAQVESDFNAALDLNILPSKTDVNDQETTIRVTKEVAQAMLGKTYLFTGRAKEAADMLDKVIDSGKYDLWRGELDMLHHAATNSCCESMLEVQKRNDPEQTWSQCTMTYVVLGWRTALIKSLGDLDASIAQGTYGFLNPRKEAYDAFVATEGVDGYRLRATMRTYESLNSEYGMTVAPGERFVGHEGIFQWKNRALKEDCIVDQSSFQFMQYINLRVMRYAEVLLLAAEAHVLGGSQTKADAYINMIRERAKLAPLSGVTLADVKNEKRLELFNECVRFVDLVRWGDAEAALAEQGKQVPAFADGKVTPDAFKNSAYGFKAKHKLLPIPRKEIELNSNMRQNENW